MSTPAALGCKMWVVVDQGVFRCRFGGMVAPFSWVPCERLGLWKLVISQTGSRSEIGPRHQCLDHGVRDHAKIRAYTKRQSALGLLAARDCDPSISDVATLGVFLSCLTRRRRSPAKMAHLADPKHPAEEQEARDGEESKGGAIRADTQGI